MGRYGDSCTCVWTIHCPKGLVFAVTNFTGNTENTYDKVSVKAMANSRIASPFSGTVSDEGLGTNLTKVNVAFTSDGSVSTPYLGFELNWMCKPVTCVDAPSLGPTVLNCSSTLECPSTENFLVPSQVSFGRAVTPHGAVSTGGLHALEIQNVTTGAQLIR